MDKLNQPLQSSSYSSYLERGLAKASSQGDLNAAPAQPPRELTLKERIEKLEAHLGGIDKAHSEQLNILADKIIRLENQVG